MSLLTRLPSRVQASTSSVVLKHPAFELYSRRVYSTSSGKQKPQKTTQSETDSSANHPIPSNNAQPTLRDGRQSPIADHQGNLRDDLPQDVKKHNEEMDKRYDKPYNHIADGGNVENGFKK